MSALLSRFKLSTQIAMLGGLGLAGIVLLAVLIVVGLNMRENLAQQLQRIEATSLSMADLEAHALQMRRHEKDFLMRRDAKYASALDDETRKTQAALKALDGNPVVAEFKGDFDRLIGQFATYQAAAVEMVALQRAVGLNENDGLQGKFRKAVHELETEATKANLDKLSISVLQLRRNEKDFLLRQDPKYVGQVKTEVAKGAGLIDASGLDSDRKNALKALLAGYEADFVELATKTGVLGTTVKKLSASFAEIDPTLDKLGKAVTDKAAQTRALIAKQVSSMTKGLYAIAGAVGLLCAAFIYIVSTGITRPMSAMTDAMGRLVKKDWTTEVPAQDRRDEIGLMAKAVQVFKETGIQAEKVAEEAMELCRLQNEEEAAKRKLAEEVQAAEQRRAREVAVETENKLRALEERMKHEESTRRAQRQAEMSALADGFEATVKGVVETVASSASEMLSSSTSMSATAERTSQQATAVATASEEASSNVQTVATAAEELSSSIQEISRQVAASSKMAKQAVDQARSTGQTVDGLAQAAAKIGDVVKLITDIASQTNLLALNATIEAARAGEAGKGFAVVASEVKSLATQTAKATEEIAKQIEAVQSATGEAVTAIQDIGKTIEQVNEVASTIASAVEEQGAATQEISRNVQQAAAGTQEVNKNIASVTEASGEVGAAATEMSGTSAELAKQAETLRREVDQFIQKVRAA